MAETLSLENLTVKLCSEDKWAEVLAILKETKMDIWLTGKEISNEFFLVKDKETGKFIACFKFSQEGHIGILKNFAVRPILQRKGIGTFIVNNIVPKVAKERGIKKLYLLGNDRPPYTSNYFWKKTIFNYIKSSDAKDQFFKDYFNSLDKIYPDELFCRDSTFYLDLDSWSK